MDDQLTIPRVASVRQADAEYDPVLVRIGPRIDVLLDGKPLSRVIAYNCTAGWVRRFVTDPCGKVRIFPGSPIVREEVLNGHVTARWR